MTRRGGGRVERRACSSESAAARGRQQRCGVRAREQWCKRSAQNMQFVSTIRIAEGEGGKRALRVSGERDERKLERPLRAQSRRSRRTPSPKLEESGAINSINRTIQTRSTHIANEILVDHQQGHERRCLRPTIRGRIATVGSCARLSELARAGCLRRSRSQVRRQSLIN